MALCTIADIEAYLGTTFDSEQSAVYQSIIDAVSDYIECQTGQDFTEGVYARRIAISDGLFVIDKNVQYLFGVYSGAKSVIEVTCPDTSTTIDIDLSAKELKIISDLSIVSTIDISSMTIATLSSTINALAGFSAEIESDVGSDLLALTVFEASYGANPNDSDKINLIAANNPLNAAKLSNGLYECNLCCSSGIAIFQGGWSTIPSDLNDLAIRMSIKAYDTRTTAVSGELKEEEIGDYRYRVFSAAEQEGLNTIAVDYQAVLDCYKVNFDI